MWRPQDFVAIILALGVVAILLSQTHINLLWLTPEQVESVSEGFDEEGALDVWKNLLNVILGALAGYIAGRHNT